MEKGSIVVSFCKRDKKGNPVGRVTVGGNSTQYMANRFATEARKQLPKNLDQKAVEYALFEGVE